ncbi:hypothetical protein [Mycobacterium sp.]|uniref:hypothetical protein n=1 Tax=Mycobacterium sp. TaxID=1785 RepID=UPI002C2FE1D7|nr:hypothetical protein [Mycobacterium sp.]HTH90471.1 hypothetical protein [Mycobacterium sp.]
MNVSSHRSKLPTGCFIDDFGASVQESGPKLRRLVAPTTKQIESLLDRLISPFIPEPPRSPISKFLQKALPRRTSDRIAQPIESLLQKVVPQTAGSDVTPEYTIDPIVRTDVKQHLEQLDTELAADAAIIEAWRDLVTSAEKLNRTVDELAYRRDTLYAIAERRNLDTVGPFGVSADLRRLLTDVPDAVQQELDNEAGRDHAPIFPPRHTPSGVPAWRRLQLCENVLIREPARGDCIVWLRLAPTSLPQSEVSHGQVTFYNASYLRGFVGHPELADRFKVQPMEVLATSPDTDPVLQEGEEEWEDEWNMAYARVELRGVELHAAEATARALVEALVAVNHADKNTWRLLNGSILFINGNRHSLFSWGPKEDMPEMFYADNDRMGRDIELMVLNNRLLNAESLHDIQGAIGMSTSLTLATAESPQATVMAAVRAIEHVNVWTTNGKKYWADFASHYFKKTKSRMRIIDLIDYYTVRAITHHVGDLHGDTAAQQQVNQIRSEIKKFVWPHEMHNRRLAADHVSVVHQVYFAHWLARGLGELDRILATPASMYKELEDQGRRFDRQLNRLKRLRNSAIHGGPLSEAGCQSVYAFASWLGHRCLNETIKAILTGRDIPSSMTDYRDDSLVRYERIRRTGDVDALFVDAVIEPSEESDETTE